MRTAFILFDRLTALDFIGAYDPLTRLHSMGLMPSFAWDLCAMQEEVEDDRGLRIGVDVITPDLSAYDLIIVPGGYGTRPLMQDEAFLGWLHTAASVPLKASVCTGALLLGAAGFLRGKRATTHFSDLAELEPYAEAVVDERVVDAGEVVTAGGVSSALDLGLYLVERIAGAEARAQIARQMVYRTV